MVKRSSSSSNPAAQHVQANTNASDSKTLKLKIALITTMLVTVAVMAKNREHLASVPAWLRNVKPWEKERVRELANKFSLENLRQTAAGVSSLLQHKLWTFKTAIRTWGVRDTWGQGQSPSAAFAFAHPKMSPA